MTRQVNIAEAKAKLSELAEAASKGEEIVLARNGKPIARLTKILAAEERKPRVFGQNEHEARHIDWDKWWEDWKAMDRETEDAYEKSELFPRGFAEDPGGTRKARPSPGRRPKG